ncbi:MAG: F0F1 ATP synthase subunit delta [Candidatus Sungiibacteriota bacterium]
MKHPPAIYAEALLEASEEKKVSSDKMRNFLVMLRKNGDLAKLLDVMRKLEALYYRREGITKVDVISGRELGEFKKEVETALRERFGMNSVIDFSVNREIIGGIILKINDELVIDASVKRRLEKLFAK